MVKKIFKSIIRIVVFIFVYIFQIYSINNVMFFGVTGDLCLMAVVLVTLLDKNYIAYITAIIFGILSDVIFSATIGRYLVIYIIVVSVLLGLRKMYKQDSKMAVIIFSIVAVSISEALMLLFNIVSGLGIVNIFYLILQLIKLYIINIFLAFVLYLVLKPCIQEG